MEIIKWTGEKYVWKEKCNHKIHRRIKVGMDEKKLQTKNYGVKNITDGNVHSLLTLLVYWSIHGLMTPFLLVMHVSMSHVYVNIYGILHML